MHLRHILVASDASRTSTAACPHAAALALAFGARVSVVFVDEAGQSPYVDTAAARRHVQRYYELVRGRLADSIALLTAMGVESPELVELTGEPAPALVSWATENAVDLIVLVRHNAPAEHRPLGSTTRAVLRRAALPVLVLNDAAEAAADRVGYARVLACTDLSRDSAAGLRQAADLANGLGADLHVVHGFQTPGWMRLVDAVDPDRDRPWHADALQRRWSEALKRWTDGVNVGPLTRQAVWSEDPASAVLRVLSVAGSRGADMDLITIPTHGKGAVAEFFLGSTTEAIIRSSPVPVLVFPRPWLTATGSLDRH